MRIPYVLLWIAHVVLSESTHRQVRALKAIPEDNIAKLDTQSVVTTFDVKNASSHLSNILVPRVSGTEENLKVQKYIQDRFEQIHWHVQQDRFEANTPHGKKQFTNLIMTHKPNATYKLVMAAHFDSKFFPQTGEAPFLGATDSAVACAMLIDLAEYLTPYFKLNAEQAGSLDDLDDDTDVTLQIIFFDGEEAFVDWTQTDSIYGARHLAEKWEKSYLQETHALAKRRIIPNPTEIDTVELFILLDLLGARKPTIPNFFRETTWVHKALQSAEKRLNDGGHFHDLEQWDIELDDHRIPDWSPELSWFKDHGQNIRVEDDHLPFLHLGVPILHVIHTPFPSIWHTIQDDASAVHVETCARWALILRLFVREYLGLVKEFPSPMRRDELVGLVADHS